MKKTASILLILAAIILLTACRSEENHESTSATSTLPVNSPEISLPVYIAGSIKINHANDYGEDDGLNYKRSFRRIYYVLPGWVSDLVESKTDDYFDFFEANTSDEEITEMYMVTFIKRFNIPKDIFVVACEKDKAFSIRMGLDIYNEYDEIPNADIIYTFDNEIINEYYRRE